MGAPRAWRYFGRNLRQRFSPPERRNMAAETRTTGEGARCAPLPLAFEPLIKLVEELRGAGDALLVVAVREGDAADQRGDAGGLLAAEGIFLQVDVVDDLADGTDAFVGDAEAVAEDLKGAAGGVVGEVATLHVERHATLP